MLVRQAVKYELRTPAGSTTVLGTEVAKRAVARVKRGSHHRAVSSTGSSPLWTGTLPKRLWFGAPSGNDVRIR